MNPDIDRASHGVQSVKCESTVRIVTHFLDFQPHSIDLPAQAGGYLGRRKPKMLVDPPDLSLLSVTADGTRFVIPICLCRSSMKKGRFVRNGSKGFFDFRKVNQEKR